MLLLRMYDSDSRNDNCNNHNHNDAVLLKHRAVLGACHCYCVFEQVWLRNCEEYITRVAHTFECERRCNSELRREQVTPCRTEPAERNLSNGTRRTEINHSPMVAQNCVQSDSGDVTKIQVRAWAPTHVMPCNSVAGSVDV